MSKKRNLDSARRNKNDEFYTQLSDIEKELRHYKDHFKDKVIYCNTDDYRYSQFFYYFFMNFKHLGLKKLICTSYNECGKGLGAIYEGEPDDSNLPNKDNIKSFELNGDGDFRSDECVKYLKESDIVVTNPPFSLFREFVDQLMEYEKKFLIIGNVNAITYKEFFPLLKDNKVWTGFNINNMEFGVPDDYPLYGSSNRIDDEGNKYIGVKGIRWYTNLDNHKRHEEIILYRKYNEKDYPKYDNYDAIEVSKVKDIPMDYDGYMGVPITFLDKYNPKQFEIIRFRKGYDEKDLSINGKCPYFRIIIKNKKAVK